MRPHRWQPTRLLGPWVSPGKNTGVLLFPSPGDLPDPGIEPGSPTLQADDLPTELFNFMAAVTICSDFGAQKIRSDTVSTVSPSISHEVMGPDAIT